MRLLIHWALSALALYIVARIVPGFYVAGYPWALAAVLVIGLVNATLGAFLKFITFPLTVITLGIFWWVINALMLMLAGSITPGLRISGFAAAFWGALALSLMNIFVRRVTRKEED